MSIANHIGYDNREDEDDNDLHEIIKDFQDKKTSKNSFFVNIKNLNDSFSPSSFKTTEGIQLKTLCKHIFTGKTPAKKDYREKGIKILKVRDLTNSGIKWNVSERGFVKDDYRNKMQLQKNDILIISSAHHPKYIGLKVDIINYIPKKYPILYCVTEILVIRPDPEKINPYELLCLLKSKSGYDAIQSCIRGQTSHIYPKDISNIIISNNRPDKKNIMVLEKLLSEKTKLDCEIFNVEQKLIREL